MQKEVIEQGITKNVDIEEYKQKNLEPGCGRDTGIVPAVGYR